MFFNSHNKYRAHLSLTMTAGLVVLLCLQFLVQPAHAQASMTVFATGLTNPRGLKFGPDGYLYVAEAGPDTNSLQTTPAQCAQVPGPIGPYSGGYNSRISRISPDGTQVTTVVDNLPSDTTPILGDLVSGVADLAFVGNTLYGIEAGAGCSHGLAGTDNTVFRVNPDGSTTTIADLSQFQKANPVNVINPADFEPDGTWYSMLAIGNTLYAIEPNHGELDRILPNGQIQRVAAIADIEKDHLVPTSFAFYRGNFYVGNLGDFPIAPGDAEVLKINIGGKIDDGHTQTGLTNIEGLVFDAQGRMYILESQTIDGYPLPFPPFSESGMVVRVNSDGSLTTIASGLHHPSGMTLGPDGALYVSDYGFGFNVPGGGQIVRIAIND